SGINVTSLPDGLLTLSLKLTDSIGWVGVATTDTIPMAVFNANLVGHWTFDSNDISGVTAYDRSGSTLNGTLQGTPTSFAGRIGGGLKFDGFGSGDRVSLGASAILNPANFTITAWVSPANISGVYGYIYSNARDCCGAYKGIEMRLAANNLRGIIWNTGFAQLTTTGTIANSSGWHHVTYTYDGSTIKLYIDGNFDSQLATAIGVGGPASFGTYIGTMGFNAGTYTLDGILDDVRIYNTVLTSGQVSTLYATH
ncbi:MAG: LamG domain-containing protein, partial [Pseudomonadota bacterium]